MPKRFKDKVDFLPSLMKASVDRINDTDVPLQSDTAINNSALAYLNNKGSIEPLNFVNELVRSSGQRERIFIKDFKFAINALNAKINTTKEFARLNAKEVFATLFEIQRQVYKLDVEVGESEIKILNGFSKVHLNTFVRQMDSQLQYGDKSWITDFKTSFSYPEKYLLNLLPSSGITLPRRSEVAIPIVDAYIVDEASDAGDSLRPVISTSPRNVFIKNKIFKHVVVRRDFDETTRKYKAKTIYDNYPYSATSQLTLELVLPNTCMVNYLKVNPVNASNFNIKDISYLNESGEEVSILSQAIDGDLFATYLFEPIYTKNLRVTFEQLSTVTKTTSIIGDVESKAISDILEGAGFSNEINVNSEEITGRWYDFSIKDIEVGEIRYENKGIYRSKSIKTSSPVGLEVNRFIEAITPEELFSEYYKTITLPEGKALSEAYVGVRLFNAQGGTVVDSIVPVVDSYPTQTEFLDFIHTDARVKLFPDLEWHLNDNCIKEVDVEEICISLEELIPDYQQEQSSVYTGIAESLFSSTSTGSKVTSTDTCLLAGEEVLIDSRGSMKAIESFAIGDTVYTYDYRLESYGEYRVTACMEGFTSGWLEIYFEGIDKPIRCSLSHHMLNGDFEQVPAYLMNEGDCVWYLNHELVLDIIEISEIIYHDEEIEVYNIEVEDAHTYITSNGVLQHNKTYTGSGASEAEPVLDAPDKGNTTFQTEAEVASQDIVSSDIADRNEWKQHFTLPTDRNLPVENRNGNVKTDDSTLVYVIGGSYADLEETYKTKIRSDSRMINESIGLDNRLMIGSDGRNAGFTKVSAAHVSVDDLNLVGRAYWNTKLVQVQPTLSSSTRSEQNYDVVLSQPPKRLSTKPLKYLSPVDRIEVKKTARINELASKIRSTVPDRSVGARKLLKSLKSQKSLDSINEFVNSMFSPQVGYRVNDRGALEIALVDDKGSADILYSREYAAIDNNLSFSLSRSYQTWQTILLSDVDRALGVLDERVQEQGIDPDEFPVADALGEVSDCVDFISFTTETPHRLENGDLVSLTSSNSKYAGLYIVSYVADDYTFYISLDSFSDLVADDGVLTAGELKELQSAKICVWNQDVESPIELYEDNRLLKIGVDYSISLDDKSTWYDYWLMPGELSYSYLNKRAKAGRFYVRVHNRKPHAIYWIKYRVKRNQALSSCEKIRLKNGRVVFDKLLRDTFGTLQTVFVFRTNSTNPYITPVLREYSLRVQEKDGSKVAKSNVADKSVSTWSVRSKRDVS